MTNKSILLTLLITAIAPIVWGSTYIVTTELLPPNRPLLAAMLRALPAGIVLVLVSQYRPNRRWLVRFAILGVLNIGLFFYCLFYAATTLPGGTAATVMSIQPILVLVLSWYWLNASLSWQQIAASVVGITGVALLVTHSRIELDIMGLSIALLGTLSMASGVVLTKKWGRPPSLTLMGFTGWQLLFGGLFLLPITLGLEGLPSHISLTQGAGFLYLSVIGAVIGYYLWFRGIETLPPITVSFLGFLSSVSACLLGYLLLDEVLTSLQLLGAGFIFISIAMAAPKNRHALPLNPPRPQSISSE